MKSPITDDELDALYQTRRSSIKAPAAVVPSAKTVERTTKPFAWGGIILASAFSSFAIFALISHLANLGQSKTTASDGFSVEISSVDHLPNEQGDIQVTDKPRLLPNETIQADQRESTTLEVAKQQSNASFTTEIKVPSVTFTTPQRQLLLKVIPEYPSTMVRYGITTQVTFSYEISMQGKVLNIELVNRGFNSEFDQSAQQALQQWLFSHTSEMDKEKNKTQRFLITFEFSLK